MKKLLKGLGIGIGIIVVLFIALMIFVPTESNVPTKVGEKDVAVPVSKEEVPVPEDIIYNIGDTVSYKGVEVTIVGAEFTEPAEYSDPENGKVLTLTIEAVNNSDNKLMVDNTEFNIYDVDGNGFDQYYGYDESTISSTVNKDKKVTGKVYFDVIDASKFELIYTPIMSFDGQTDIVFNIEVPNK